MESICNFRLPAYYRHRLYISCIIDICRLANISTVFNVLEDSCDAAYSHIRSAVETCAQSEDIATPTLPSLRIVVRIAISQNCSCLRVDAVRYAAGL